MSSQTFFTSGQYVIASSGTGSLATSNEVVFSTRFNGASGSIALRRKTDADTNALRVACTDMLTLATNAGVLAVNGTWLVGHLQNSVLLVDAVVAPSSSITVYVA